MLLKTEYANYQVETKKAFYGNGNLAVILENSDGFQIGKLTVNLGLKLDDGYAYLDTNNLPEGEVFVKEYGLAEFTGKYGRSGYCEYPLYRFNMEKLGE